MQELAEKSRVIFDDGAQAVGRTAVLEPLWSAAEASQSQMRAQLSQSLSRVAGSESKAEASLPLSESRNLSRLRAAFDEKVRLCACVRAPVGW